MMMLWVGCEYGLERREMYTSSPKSELRAELEMMSLGELRASTL